MTVYLASRSPRRVQLLQQVGLECVVRPSSIDEERVGAGQSNPRSRVEQLALAKARDAAGKLSEGLVVGADTVVVCQGEILGKPGSAPEATEMLRLLNGRTHEVISGVAVVQAPGGREEVASELTRVTFRELAPEEIAAYVASGEPLDKAGGYGIQGRGALLVSRIEGCYFNVVGLPLVCLAELLRDFGMILLGGRANRRGIPGHLERLAP